MPKMWQLPLPSFEVTAAVLHSQRIPPERASSSRAQVIVDVLSPNTKRIQNVFLSQCVVFGGRIQKHLNKYHCVASVFNICSRVPASFCLWREVRARLEDSTHLLLDVMSSS